MLASVLHAQGRFVYQRDARRPAHHSTSVRACRFGYSARTHRRPRLAYCADDRRALLYAREWPAESCVQRLRAQRRRPNALVCRKAKKITDLYTESVTGER